jgi:class 3 adenylate cyclase/PAS domain-containing protein
MGRGIAWLEADIALAGTPTDGYHQAVAKRPVRVESKARLPDQNPNPVLQVTSDGLVVYANASARIVEAAWGARVGEPVPAEWLARLRAAAASGVPAEIEADHRTFELLVVDVPDEDVMHVYGTDVTAVRLVARFPEMNPNPVLRVSREGVLLYANSASAEFLAHLAARPGDPLPPTISTGLRAILDGEATGPFEARSDGRTYALTPVLVEELDLVNVYATDVTARKAIEKFPDENPNPVFRFDWDGRLVYANQASRPIIEAVGGSVGAPLASEVLAPLMARVRAGDRGIAEMEAGGRRYALKAVDVPAFGFINVYGTDVTAARQLEAAHQRLEALHRENERLLLNILPPPIADRLRRGERLIADRHDDVTIMFADIVEFTRISSTLDPQRLVSVLNDVFSDFDDLVARHGLEKVKTIGDAYMVVGGMNGRADDHAGRVASMALDLAGRVEALTPAAALGFRFRIGMHCGPIVAGVIGSTKFIYDVWGDAVNMASRMESLGVPGRIQVTGAIEERLRDRFAFEPRGLIDVKGKGPTPTWFLVGRAASGARRARRVATTEHRAPRGPE